MFVLLIWKVCGIITVNTSRLAPTHADEWTGQGGMKNFTFWEDVDILQFEISYLTAPAALDFARQLNCADIGEEVEFSANLKWVEPFGALLTATAIKQLRD